MLSKRREKRTLNELCVSDHCTAKAALRSADVEWPDDIWKLMSEDDRDDPSGRGEGGTIKKPLESCSGTLISSTDKASTSGIGLPEREK